jgi:signal transduction histidine kinase
MHDLRGTLGILTLQAELLLECLRRQPIPSVTMVQQSAARILSATSLTHRLLRELAASTEGDAAEVRIETTMVDLRRLLTETIELSMPATAALEIELHASVEDDRPVRADAAQLQRVIGNLVTNAIEAIARGPGAVHIRVSTLDDGWVRISVQDSGPGLRGESDVFRPFETTKGGHSGLGLAIASEIVRAHGGRIRARPGTHRGAIFDIDLPRYGPESIGEPAVGGADRETCGQEAASCAPAVSPTPAARPQRRAAPRAPR